MCFHVTAHPYWYDLFVTCVHMEKEFRPAIVSFVYLLYITLSHSQLPCCRLHTNERHTVQYFVTFPNKEDIPGYYFGRVGEKHIKPLKDSERPPCLLFDHCQDGDLIIKFCILVSSPLFCFVLKTVVKNIRLNLDVKPSQIYQSIRSFTHFAYWRMSGVYLFVCFVFCSFLCFCLFICMVGFC